MFSDTTLIIINATSILFLVMMLVALTAATRMKGGAGWAALIIVTTTVPVYLSNLARDLGSDYYVWLTYICYFLNTLCIPSLWFFTHSQLDKSFRLTWRNCWHLLPAFVSLAVTIIYYAPMSSAEVIADMEYMQSGKDSLPILVNDFIVLAQMLIYFPLMLRYIHRRKKYLRDHFADSDFFTIKWIGSFIAVFFGLFILVFIAYAINPRTDIWLIPILNVIAMGYLVYIIIFRSTQAYINRLPVIPQEKDRPQPKEPPMSAEVMKEVCDKVIDYLRSSGAYRNSDLTIATLSHETGIHHKIISAAINGYLHKNFFELVNGLRVEEAKRLLLERSASNYTTESVFAECGFRSRSTFYMTFKKFEGTSPAQWVDAQRNGNTR